MRLHAFIIFSQLSTSFVLRLCFPFLWETIRYDVPVRIIHSSLLTDVPLVALANLLILPFRQLVAVHIKTNRMVGRSSYGGRLGSVWIRKKLPGKQKQKRHPSTATTGADDDADDGHAGINVGGSKKKSSRVGHDFDVPPAVAMAVAVATSSSSSSETEPDHRQDHHDSPFSSAVDSSPDSFSADAGGGRRLIGWDEDLCRPIYEMVTVRTQKNRDGGNDSGSDENQDGDDEEEAGTGDANLDDAAEEDDEDGDGDGGLPMSLTLESYTHEAVVAPITKSKSSSRTSRSYGGRKRGRAGLSAAAEAVLLDGNGSGTNCGNVKRIKRTTAAPSNSAATSPTKTATTVDTKASASTSAITTNPVVPAEFDVQTPQPYGNNSCTSICNMLDSDVQKSTNKTNKLMPAAGAGGWNKRGGGTHAHTSSRSSQGLVLDMDADSTKEEGEGQLKQQHHLKEEETNKNAKSTTTTTVRRLSQYGSRRHQPRKLSTAGKTGSTAAAGNSKNAKETSELDFFSTEDNKAEAAAAAASTKLNQPCGQTTLSAARVFFEHLDSTHQLALDNALQSPEIRRNRGSGSAHGAAASQCIRTSRTVGVDDPQLLREYKEYCDTTEVTPLPLRDYVKHRTSFFHSSTTICDGLLDD